MRVLLIEPPFERFIGQRCEWYPIGLTVMASVLENHGHIARVYNAEHDNNLNYINTEVYLKKYIRYPQALSDDEHIVWKESGDVVQKFAPEVIGISVKSVKIPSAIKIATICKKINPNAIIVAGGFHPTTKPDDLLKSGQIDFVVRGEGEETFLELINGLQTTEKNIEEIKGISFKNERGDIIHTGDRGLVVSLDSLPLPRRELIWNYEDYTPDQLGWVMTSRGCPYDCAYCNSKAIWSRKVRFIGIAKVIEEIKYLRERFHVAHMTIMDDSFTVNKRRVLDFCNILKEQGKEFTWSCLTRADLVDDEIAAALKAGGCAKVDIGIESGSERIQRLINKRIKLDDVERIAKTLRKHGIFWTGFFMIGFPTETKEDMLETLKFMEKVKPNWAYLSIFTPYHGSLFYEMARRDGLVIEAEDASAFSHQSPNNCFSRSISPTDFQEMRELMFNKFNSYNNSFKSLLRRAQSRKYYKNPRAFLGDLRKALSWLKTK